MRKRITLRPAEPIGAINVTPFIDVMLVLLVMLILTIPIASHKLPVDLPAGGQRPAAATPPHLLGIGRGGALSWDGRPIGDGELHALLAGVGATRGQALHLQTDPDARYERFSTVLGEVKRAGVERLGFVGNRPFE